MSAPIAIVSPPIASMTAVSAENAVTPIIANGATNETFTRTSAITFVKSISDFAFVVAFSIPDINFSIPTKANKGIAIARSAATPMKGRPPAYVNAPTADKGISKSVNAVANIVKAVAFLIALSTPDISFNIPTNAKRGTAIAVKPKMPTSMSLI